jgi:hypothetical protein
LGRSAGQRDRGWKDPDESCCPAGLGDGVEAIILLADIRAQSVPLGTTARAVAASMLTGVSSGDERQVSSAEAVELPLPRFQQQMVDWLELEQRRHAVHSLLEIDVAAARASIRAYRARSGGPLSFTAYLIGCLARAIDRDKRMAAIRHGRRRMLVFDEVDIALPVESDVEDEAIPVPHIIRGANRKSLTEISREIMAGSRGPVPYAGGRRFLAAWLLLPAWLRRRMLELILADARRRKRLTGTVLVTAVSLPGKGRAWGIPNGTHYPISLLIGGLHLGDDGRETVALTLTFDHDTVNGASAARFVRRFALLVENGELIDEQP